MKFYLLAALVGFASTTCPAKLECSYYEDIKCAKKDEKANKAEGDATKAGAKLLKTFTDIKIDCKDIGSGYFMSTVCDKT